MEFPYECYFCNDFQVTKDEGQHITIFVCQCGHSGTVRHRPDPAPLPPRQEHLRVQTLYKISDAFNWAAILLRNKNDFPWLQHVQQSALDTVNFLYGYTGRKTIMTGKKN